MFISDCWTGWMPLALFLLCALSATGTAMGQEKAKGSIEQKTAKWEHYDGLLTTFIDHDAGRLWLKLPPPTDKTGLIGEFIYTEGLSTGIGQTATGLDRGELGRTHVVRFRRIGGKLLVEAVNTGYRAVSDNPAERTSVAQSFPPSVLWSGPVDSVDIDGSALVDFTSFVVRDAHDSAGKLAANGGYALDANRSVLDPGNCLVFPDNLEFEAFLTFASAKPGETMGKSVPAPQAISIVQHHSLVRLPDEGFKPRRHDPRCGSYPVPFLNFSAPADAPLDEAYIERFRLEKAEPLDKLSRPVKPIVYYLDSGVPEPYRSAILEGAGWWAKAFESAGFRDAFRVELLPEGVNPLDARHNVIQWFHRTTRGSSYGRNIVDPRTGEIIKGHAILESQRLRQVRLIFEGLAGADKTGKGGQDDPIQLALTRIRQLAVHEVGHTLGFAHNFAASATPGCASVMDYPAPRVSITPKGDLDFSNAYDVGLGPWDVLAARYAYTEFPSGADESAGLKAILDEADRKGFAFLADNDARGAGAANPRATMWDNGDDPVVGLQHAMRVRRIALDRFGAHNILPGIPLARLEETFAPVYFHHRFQLTAALKMVGGVDYNAYTAFGPGPAVTIIDGEQQTKALRAVLACLSPDELDIPESVLERLPPRPYGLDRNNEMFKSGTGPAFDALGAARSAAEMVVGGLLNPERCARLVDFHRRDSKRPGLEVVLEALAGTAFGGKPSKSPRTAEIRRVVQDVVVSQMVGLASNTAAPLAVRSRVDAALVILRDGLVAVKGDAVQKAYNRTLADLISRHLSRPLSNAPEPPPAGVPPPGAPLGSWGEDGM